MPLHTIIAVNLPDPTSAPAIQPSRNHALIDTRLPRGNLPFKNIQIAVPTRRQLPRHIIDQRPHAPQAGPITIPIRNHAGILLEEVDDRGDERVDGPLIAHGPRLIVHARKLGHPNRFPVFRPVVPHIVHHAVGSILVRMDARVIPRRLRDPERLHEGREPILVQLRGHGRRSDECISAHFAEGGFPGGGGGGRVHVAGVRGLPVGLVESHHVIRGGGSGEGFEGVVAVYVVLGGVADGSGRVGRVEVAVAP